MDQNLLNLVSDVSDIAVGEFFKRKISSFSIEKEDYEYVLNEPDFTKFSQVQKIGKAEFDDSDELIVLSAKFNGQLTERSSKKQQYEIAKKILKEDFKDGAIFVFYDNNGNFRFSFLRKSYGDKTQKFTPWRRFTYFVSPLKHNKTFLSRIDKCDFSSLDVIQDAFSVEPLTKQFYKELSYWYHWAVENSSFPAGAEEQKEGRNIAIIRLITRMIFVWFMKERGLIPNCLFDKKHISDILLSNEDNESTYYKAILQNLFFATLSTKVHDRKFASEERTPTGWNEDYGNQYVFRHHELFKEKETLKNIFQNIPFLNGGLFDCLDDRENKKYIDGFSRITKNQPHLPNILFFAKEIEYDLNDVFGTKNTRYKIDGLLEILNAYNFTIDENTPDDADVALDPELLGKVFENLLASFNPETASTARKSTGSYYTPREIVDYMVGESLKAYFSTHMGESGDADGMLEELFSNSSDKNPFNEIQSRKLVKLIHNVKILDPAVGSGAFPMGALKKMVFLLNKLDPDNSLWEKEQLDVLQEIPDPNLRNLMKEKVKEYFSEQKNRDYGRKLFLIQRCIHGVDIQQIAIEISKLRFFISLLVDETIDKTKENWGIEPLPNLDFKMVAANTLISPEQDAVEGGLFEDDFFFEFNRLTELYFSMYDPKEKNALKEQIINHINGKIDEKLKEIKRLKDNLRSQKDIDVFDKQIAIWKSYGNLFKNEAVGFFEPKYFFPEVKDGFDIVIGNPPYVSANNMSIHERNFFNKSTDYITLKGKWDLYIAFTEKSLKSLKKFGSFSFILPYGVLNQPFAETLRVYILNNYKLLSIVDLHNNKIFENATIPSCIPIIQNQKSKIHKVSILEFKENRFNSKYSIDIQKYHDTTQNMFRTEDLNLISNLLFKLKQKTITLDAFFYVSTGAEIHGKEGRADDGTTVSGRSKFDVLTSEFKEGLKPYIEGSAIKKSKDGRYSFPEIDTWLDYNKSDKMRSPKFKELFDSEKIIIRRSSGLLRILAIFDNQKIYTSEKCILIINKSDLPISHRLYKKESDISLKYLLGIINSRVIDFYYKSVYGGFIDVYPNNLKELQIKLADTETQKTFISLVDQILTAKKTNPLADTTALERQIDLMVYKLYELSYDEVLIVDPEFWMSEREYDGFQ